MLTGPSQTSSVVKGPSRARAFTTPSASVAMGALVVKDASPIAPIPSTMLVSGPTTAIKNSAPGDDGSCSMFEIPPKRNSVMLRTRSP